MKNRRGFALITVILVSAILIASGFIFARSIATERFVGQSDGYYKLALDMAEAGLARAMQDVRTENGVMVGGSYLTSTNFEAMKVSTTPQVLDEYVYSELGTGRKVGTFRVTATRASIDTTAKVMGIRLKSEGRVYPSNVSLSALPTTVEAAGRRFIELSVLVDYASTAEWDATSLKLAAFSGGTMTVDSKAIIRGGDVYSNSNIDFANHADVAEGVASAKNGVSGGSTYSAGPPPAGAIATPANTTIPFPLIDLPGFQAKSRGFVMGTTPYDGVTPIDPTSPGVVYPSTASDPSKSWNASFQDALTVLRNNYVWQAPVGTTPGYWYLPGSKIGVATTFLGVLQSLLTAPSLYVGDPTLTSILSTVVFYFKGDVSCTQDNWTSGTFVIDGNASFTGNSIAGNRGFPALYVTGNLKMDGTPGQRFDGLFVVEGNFNSTSNVTIHGAVWTGGTMKLSGLNDGSKILFDPKVGDVPFPFYEDVPGVSATAVSGSWKELPN